jgi:hypothetical protein
MREHLGYGFKREAGIEAPGGGPVRVGLVVHEKHS